MRVERVPVALRLLMLACTRPKHMTALRHRRTEGRGGVLDLS